MVKSVKAIILVSVMVSMSVMLINSCGVSSPTASTGNTGVLGLSAATGGCVPSVPGMPDPSIYLPTGISSDAAKALLENPNANPNASGTPVPFNQVCGNYYTTYSYFHSIDTWDGKTTSPYTLNYGMRTDIWLNNIVPAISSNINTLTAWSWTGAWDAPRPNPPPNPPWTSYKIPCNLLPNASVPPNMFAGKGYPDGDYVIGGDWFSLVGGKATWKGRVTPCTPDGARPKKPKTLTDLTIEPATLTVGVGQTASFSAIAHYSDGSTQDVTGNSATLWSTQISGFPQTNPPGTAVAYTAAGTMINTKNAGLNALNVTTPAGLNAAIAANPTGAAPSVSNGILSSPTKSSVLVLADYTEGGITKSGQGTATFDNKYTAIKVTPSKATVYIHNDPKTATFTAKGVLPPNNIQEVINNNDINWTSSDINMATIDNAGKATAGTTPGTVQIKAAYIPDSTLFSNPDAELYILCRKYKEWGQGQSPWGSDAYDNYHREVIPYITTPQAQFINTMYIKSNPTDFYTIKKKGCALTGYSIMFDSLGMVLNGQNVNPSVLNYWLNNNGGYKQEYNPLLMQYIGTGYIDADFVSKSLHNLRTYPASIGDIDPLLPTCSSIMVQVKSNPNKPGFHYVVVTGKKGNDYEIIDPIDGQVKTLARYNNTIYSITEY